MRSPKSNAAKETKMRDDIAVVKCRPGPLIWILGMFFIGISVAGIVIFWMPTPAGSRRPFEDSAVSTLVFSLLLLARLVFGIYGLRARIVADEVWLRWRDLSGWKEVRWEEVSDFYDQVFKGKTSAVFETPAGLLRVSSENWTHVDGLRDLAVKRANHAPNREWAERGSREREIWPFTFDYNTTDNRFLRFVVPFFLLFLAGVFVSFLPKVWSTGQTLGWGWGIATLLMASILFLKPLILGGMHTRFMIQLGRRRRDRLFAQEDGLEFEAPDRSLTPAWSDITRCTIHPGRMVVETTRGEFECMSVLRDYRVLRNLLERKAPEAMERGRRDTPDPELLPLRFPVRPDEQVFHYRLRTYRALLWMSTITPIAPMMILVGHTIPALHDYLPQMNAGSEAIPILIGGFALYACYVLYTWERFCRGRIVLDDMGLTQYLPFGKQTILWGDIQEYYTTAHAGVVLAPPNHIRFWIGVTELEKLKMEVARRAIRSRTTQWEKRLQS